MPLYQHVMVGQAAARPVRLLRRRRRGRLRQGGRPGQRRAAAGRPRRLGQQPADARPALAAQGPPGLVEEPTPRRQRPPGLDPEPGRRGRAARPRGPAARRSSSSSAGPAATPPSSQCLDAGVRLTSREERDEIFAFVEDGVPPPRPTRTSHVLGYHEFLDGLTRGIAAHHAGLLPDLQGGRRGALRPRAGARSSSPPRPSRSASTCRRAPSCSRSSTKWNGETHADITPGEYTQLTGRAGRRGIDVEGHAVVLWQPGMDPRERRRPRLHPHLPAALVASGRRTTWRSTWSHQFGRARARELLEHVVRAVPGRPGRRRARPPAAQGRGGARRLRRGRDLPPRRLHGVRRPAAPDLRRREGRRKARSAPTARDEAVASLERARPGDVIHVPTGKFAGLGRRHRPRPRRPTSRGPTCVTADRQARRLALARLPDARSSA